jgi:sec-independent protein translocase protein TatA
MGLDNPLHIAFLLIILLLVFGAKRLPEMGRSLGTGMREFRESLAGQSPPPVSETRQDPAAPVAVHAESQTVAAAAPASEQHAPEA